MNTKSLLLAITSCLGFTACAAADTAPGDRGTDVNVTFPPTLLMQNGGPIIDVKHPPQKTMHAATGDGITDDTAAFQDAYDLLKQNFAQAGRKTPLANAYIYIPDGTYRVSDTIIYRGAAVETNHRDDLCFIRFVGQSRAKTIIRLVDHAPGFQDAKHPRPVIAFQHPDTEFNNGATANFLRNLTINVGSDNPGAAGVMFQGANQTDMRNLNIVSGDGAGQYGVWFKIGSVQGYYTDITIQGFDYGIYDIVNAEGDPVFEHLTLKGQRLAGIDISGGGISLRKLLSDQSAHGVPALKISGSGVQAVLFDSALNGGSASNSAVEIARNDEESLFARDVSTSGYREAVRRAGTVAVPGSKIEEYVTSPVKTLFDGQKTTSLNVPVQDTPAVPWYDPAKDWAIVDEFPSVQAAMNSGKPVICFKQKNYKLTGNISVPASVKFVNMLGASLEGGAMIVDKPSSDPVLFQDGGVAVRVEAQRNVIERCFGRNISNPKALPVTFFLENVNDCASGDQFCQRGATVFARQIDVEYVNVPQIVCNGGTLWIMGFKTEDRGAAAPFIVKHGGTLEILGGYVNAVTRLAPPDQGQSPMITNEDSNASVTCFTNMTNYFATAVKETQKGTVQDAPNTDFPLRGGGYRSNYVVPLYVGRAGN